MKKPAKDRFLHACKGRAALGKGIKDVISLNDVIFAFSSARLSPLLTKEEFKQLFKALEVYHDEEKELVNFMKVRESTWSRDINSYRGIFPKMVSELYLLTLKLEQSVSYTYSSMAGIPFLPQSPSFLTYRTLDLYPNCTEESFCFYHHVLLQQHDSE